MPFSTHASTDFSVREPAGPDDHWLPRAQAMADGIRRRALAHVVSRDGGYLSQACSSAELFAALYARLMRLAPLATPLTPPPFAGVPDALCDRPTVVGHAFHGPRRPDCDRFFLSPAQYALILYVALVEAGRMHPDGLEQFNADGATVEMIGAEHSPGMEAMTGSLGQGLSQAAGVAWARKRKGESGQVWVLASDGEFQSGQNWEAVQAAAFFGLDNLRILIDANGQQCDGRVETVMTLEPFADRLRSFGARVFEVDGHDLSALVAAGLSEPDGRPLAVIARTNPTQGLPLLQARAPKLHYVRFADDAERAAYADALAQWETIS